MKNITINPTIWQPVTLGTKTENTSESSKGMKKKQTSNKVYLGLENLYSKFYMVFKTFVAGTVSDNSRSFTNTFQV
ncbi:hypothetical protein [Winogradskyella psychrotolerans]|uniref:hypothetical protein n=1 Tax=Winogradskyella psychrotolerans TaxID=1344585 RepID=UPI001C079C58|nr:hypothetical protein [Winogradskyella psychrotolerans]MBU2927774.1 hypothetical protein [Winogradskyella psychrotolerans]